MGKNTRPLTLIGNRLALNKRESMGVKAQKHIINENISRGEIISLGMEPEISTIPRELTPDPEVKLQ